MDGDFGLDALIEILEEYRKAGRFSTITVQVRDYEYAHVKRTETESKSIQKKNKKHGKTGKHATTDR